MHKKVLQPTGLWEISSGNVPGKVMLGGDKIFFSIQTELFCFDMMGSLV